ncbi:MAG: ferritin family protein [Candidatus Omnitrophica bacterium]|nr:ferritin family protein [Candidatus Omnitrophota bacterium]MBU1996141.1 ferritin family protein [Candidatus Omnitrophota bacterium]MBU4334826.1 ferritin family protein [Candidatus Omnitrophota bacterium]
MTRKYSVSEVLQIGVEIEKNGRDFYQELVNLSDEEDAVKIFTYLADQESNHINAFKKMLDSIQDYGQQEVYPDEYFSYLSELASEHVFTKENKGKEAAASVKTPVEAVDLGIKFEEDSIALFEAMKKVVPLESQSVLDVLISQEHGHLKDLSEIKEVLKLRE